MSGTRTLIVAAAIALSTLATTATAAPLNLTSHLPDITASSLNFTYNPAGCAAGGFTLCYSGPAAISTFGLTPDFAEYPVDYSILAVVDPSGNLLPGGTMTLGPYLTGTIEKFGFAFAGGSSVLEFLVDITGGSKAGVFGPRVGVIGAVFDFGSFTEFTTATAQTDTFPVPEPMTLTLVGIGLAVSGLRRRCRA